MTDKYSNLPLDIKKKHLGQLKDYVHELQYKPELKSLFIEMTLNCNAHCRHCGSSCGDIKMENQLTDDEILSFLEDLANKVETKPFLNITGGEPMLRPNFIELMHKITGLGYNWGMTTNGTLIDKDMIYKLHYAGLKTVSVSLDGLEETHNWFRQVSDGYEKALEAIKLLAKGNFKNVMVTTVVHKKNIDQLDELYKIVKETGADTWRVINMEPIGRAKDNPDLLLDTEDYKRMIDFIRYYYENDNEMEVTYGCNHWLGVEDEHRLRNWYYKCGAGLTVASVCYNGDIMGCLDIERIPQVIQGNIRNDDFLDIWNNKFYIFRYNRAETSDYCKDCSEKDFCRGGGFHTWNVNENKPELCLFNKFNKQESTVN